MEDILTMDYENFSRTVSTKMQNLRANAGITQKDMAKQLNVSKTYISNIERGITKLPAYLLLQYCEILHVSPNKVIGYEMDDAEQILDDIHSLSELQIHIIKDIIKEFKKNNR